MQTFTSVSEVQGCVAALRSEGKTIALVPTMGALHAGHLSLIELAKQEADAVVVSIFVNPTQFGPNEDFAKYPRDLESDLAQCAAAGATAVFAPTADVLYPKGFSTYVVEESVSKPLEGISRPSHFRGVTTVVALLFNIVRPDVAVFGQKDAQQVAVIRKMVADLHFSVRIVVAPTLREADGLAMSSRNRYLSGMQRQDAACIHKALVRAKEMVAAGERRVDRVVAEMTHMISQVRRFRIIYVTISDRETMEPLRGGELEVGKAIIAVAVWVDEVRLIDNELL